METQGQDTDTLDGRTLLHHQLDAYPWDQDQEFQGGLRAILGSVNNPEQVEHLTLRAKCYYFARKSGGPVDFDGYKQHVEAQRSQGSNGVANRTLNLNEGLDYTTPSTHAPEHPSPDVVQDSVEAASGDGAGGMANAPKPASFAEICEMIAAGKPIPGIKDIPDTVLEGQKSERSKEVRAKPWERPAAASEEQPSWMRA